MSVIQGEGEYRYEITNDWAKVPAGMEWREVGAIAIDDKDNVYVFNRGPHPMMVFDRAGNFLRSWGEGLYKRAHGAHFAPDGTLYLTDDGDHTVRQCTTDGKVLMTIGVPGRPTPYMSQEPFNRCTHTALSPQGDLYVSDGYGNARIHKYLARRQAPVLVGRARDGAGAIQSAAQHLLRRGRLGVRRGPRKPSRAGLRRQRQVRDAVEQPAPPERHLHASGQVPDLLHRRMRPGDGRQSPVAQPRAAGQHRRQRRQAARALRRHRKAPGNAPGQFISPHGIAVDSRGDVYVGEVSATAWPQLKPDVPVPGHCIRCAR